MTTEPIALKYLRRDRLPTMFCPGCGIGTVMTSFAQAVDEVGLDSKQVAIVTGIGCTGRIAGYLELDSLHGTHGRALAVATGAQAVRPDITFVVFLGDGDGLSIGGNHLIHAARRNVKLTAIMVNNLIYGLTGGQLSPTTPLGIKSTTSPAGASEKPFDASRLVAAAGASYVARWTTMHPRQLKDAIVKGLKNPGFSFIEAVSQCPPIFGRRNAMAEPEDLTEWLETHAWQHDKENGEGKLEPAWPLGEFVGGGP